MIKLKCSKCKKIIKGLPAYYEGKLVCQICYNKKKYKRSSISAFWEKWRK